MKGLEDGVLRPISHSATQQQESRGNVRLGATLRAWARLSDPPLLCPRTPAATAERQTSAAGAMDPMKSASAPPPDTLQEMECITFSQATVPLSASKVIKLVPPSSKAVCNPGARRPLGAAWHPSSKVTRLTW